MTNIRLYCFASYHPGVAICMLTTGTNEQNNKHYIDIGLLVYLIPQVIQLSGFPMCCL